ncbi:MAG: hypothetical protein FWD68_19950 [Alphaproteobacteria bacterium]|nr:hypothetical protein [Alphaproteobacteria bacterium]
MRSLPRLRKAGFHGFVLLSVALLAALAARVFVVQSGPPLSRPVHPRQHSAGLSSFYLPGACSLSHVALPFPVSDGHYGMDEACGAVITMEFRGIAQTG